MSRTWKLINMQGGTDFDHGQLDIDFGEDGILVELTDPDSILDQRLRKGSITRRGTNPDAPAYGTLFRQSIGQKNIPGSLGRDVGRSLAQFVVFLERSQAEVARRVPLEPAEMIDQVVSLTVRQDTLTSFKIAAQIQNQAQEQQTVFTGINLNTTG